MHTRTGVVGVQDVRRILKGFNSAVNPTDEEIRGLMQEVYARMESILESELQVDTESKLQLRFDGYLMLVGMIRAD